MSSNHFNANIKNYYPITLSADVSVASQTNTAWPTLGDVKTQSILVIAFSFELSTLAREERANSAYCWSYDRDRYAEEKEISFCLK